MKSEVTDLSKIGSKKPTTDTNSSSDVFEDDGLQKKDSSSVNEEVTEVFRDGAIKNDDVQLPTNEDLLFAESQAKGKGMSDLLGMVLICLLIAFGGFLFGFDIGYIGGLFAMENFKEYFGTYHKSTQEYYFTNAKTGIIVAIFTIGACFGGIFLSGLPNKYGRKFALSSVCIIYVVGVLIQVTCTKHKHAWIQLLIGRLVSGFGFGGVGSTAPMMLGETAPARLRSMCVSFYQLMVTFGVFIGKCCNLGTKNYPDSSSAQWRIQIGLCFLWALLMMTGITFVPESARYLIQKDRIEEARKTLTILNKVPGDDPLLQKELDIIVYAIAAERLAGKGTFKDLLSTKTKVFQRMVMGIMLQTLQQFTGANYFLYYGTIVFKAVGLKDSYKTSVIIGIVNFGSTFFSLFVVHRYGRRQVLLTGAACMAVCMIIYAAIGSKKLYIGGYSADAATSKSAGDVMIAFTCIYIFIYSISWAPLAFVVCAESFPLNVKSLCVSINMGTHLMWASIISFFTPFITGAIHFSYGYVFFGCLVFSVFYVFFFVPETKNLTLEEVNDLWMDDVVPWKSAKWVPYARRGGNYNEEALKNTNEKGFKKFF
ncbi:hypothetical protein ACO0SA_001489 [Hanseniaspora valbyensis]